MRDLKKEKQDIIKSFYGMTLSDIYEERHGDMLRIDEINDALEVERNA